MVARFQRLPAQLALRQAAHQAALTLATAAEGGGALVAAALNAVDLEPSPQLRCDYNGSLHESLS